MQEAFVRLWKSRIQPRGDLVTYTFACVRNAALEAVRRHRTPMEFSASIFDTRQPEPAVAAIESERRDRVRAAVETLESAQQEVVVLHLYAGLTFQQIADVLGEPLQTVASRYRRALVRIKETVGTSL